MPNAPVDLEKNTLGSDGLPESSTASSSASSSQPNLELKSTSNAQLKPHDYTLPKQNGNAITRYLRFTFWTTYRKLFTVVYAVNMAVLVAILVENHGTPNIAHIVSAASANLMFAALFRQENLVNLCYRISVSVPHSFPLAIRRRLAKVFHYPGGGHGGAGTAAAFWMTLYGILVTRTYILDKDTATRANLITSWILAFSYSFIVLTSHPRFRLLFHNYFEIIHRAGAWIALLVFWLHIGLLTHAEAKLQGVTLGAFIIHEPNFWFITVSSSCNVLNWLRLRHREVFPEVLSDEAIRLHFKYRSLRPFYGIKVSTSPFLFWHALPTTPTVNEDGTSDGFSAVISSTNDWTREMIKNPVKKIWVRGYPLHGFLYTSRLFQRIVVVATGSSIDACLSLLQADVTPRRVIWAAPHPETTYGPNIVNAVLKGDPEAIIWNTHTHGRPDMVALTYQLVRESNAEAVFIVSDRKITRQVVYAMETRGIPAYGSIFDV